MLQPIFTEEEGRTISGVQDLLNEEVGSVSAFQQYPKRLQKSGLEAALGEDSPLVNKILDAINTVSAV